MTRPIPSRVRSAANYAEDQLNAAERCVAGEQPFDADRLSAALADFVREFELAAPGELARRADVVKASTASGSRYHDAVLSARKACGDDVIPFHHLRALKHSTALWFGLSSLPFAEQELASVLGQQARGGCDRRQVSALAVWERELSRIIDEARDVRSSACEWLRISQDPRIFDRPVSGETLREIRSCIDALRIHLSVAPGVIDERDYVAFSDAQRPDGMTEHDFRKFIEKHGVRTHSFRPQRKSLHAGDLARAVATHRKDQEALLDLSDEVISDIASRARAMVPKSQKRN